MFNELICMMNKEYIDGFFISNPSNVQYISGYRHESAYALITEKGRYLLTDGRYTQLAAKTCKDFEIINWKKDERKLNETIKDIVKKENIRRLGFEAEYITYKQFTEFYDAIQAEITPVVGLIEQLRIIKTPEEISYLRKACEINDRVFERILKDIKVGISEKELSALCSYYLRIEGGDSKVSENIFLSGKRSSLISAPPIDNNIEYGDLILINFGSCYKGYMSDFSRSVVVGNATQKQKEIYSIVQRAQMAAIETIKAGVLAKEPYYASENIIRDTKYFPFHYKGMGHGIGLFLFEDPFLGKHSKNILEKNHVLTVEPGLYIPDWGGIRIEDMIVVTEDGYELLSKSSRDLIII